MFANTLTIEDVRRLAQKIGIDPDEAIAAFKASDSAPRPLRDWQRANQEQAKIVSKILMEHEGEMSML